MRRAEGKGLGVAAWLCAALLWLSITPTPATNALETARSNSSTARRVTLGALSPELALPPPANRCPITFFRGLLTMTVAERTQALTNRSPESRAQILAKVHEYQSLEPDERELRLQVTELHWYLLPLMTAPATNRPAELAAIPVRLRSLVEDRVREWDKLTPEVKQELLENQATLRYLAEIEGRTEEQRRRILASISPARRAMLKKGIARWAAMSPDQRHRTLNRFNQFFELTAQEKEKALKTLSGAERRQIEKTLEAFAGLPAAQRTACIRSFAKFASLSLEERHQFLKSAERWQAMSPSERQTWRDLVRNLPPPLPPDLPPLPPARDPPRRTTAIATNGN